MKNFLCLSFTTILLISCSGDDNPQPGPNPPADYEKGILITNEGPFNNGSGSVTYVSQDFTDVEQHIYLSVNGKDLGNIVQSLGFQEDKAYIVVNNSQKLEVVDRYTFESLDSIKSGLNNPRYFVGTDGNKGYVTNWGDPNDNNDDFVAVVDLRSNNVSASIPVSFGPEKMVYKNGKIYVAHQGGFGQNNLISIISGSSIDKTITVGDVPNSMVTVGNSLYVLCGGNPNYTGSETSGMLVKIDLDTNQVVQTFSLQTNQHPTALTADGDNLYYNLDGKVYKINSTSVNLPGTAIIDGFFYAMEAHNGRLYATDAGDFASNGNLKVYDLSTNKQLTEVKTGIIPGGIYFND